MKNRAYFIAILIFLQNFCLHAQNNREEKVESVHPVVDEMTEFPGGDKELYKFISKNLKPPESVKATQIDGKIFVEFTIEENGSVSGITILRGIGREWDEEVIRVVSLTSGMWKPAERKNLPVRSIKALPIFLNFK